MKTLPTLLLLLSTPVFAEHGFPDWVKFPPQVGLAEGQALTMEDFAEVEFPGADGQPSPQRGKHWVRWLKYTPAKGEAALGYYNGSEARIWKALEPVLKQAKWLTVVSSEDHMDQTLKQPRDGKTFWARLKVTAPTGELSFELIEVGAAPSAFTIPAPAKKPEVITDDADLPWLPPFPGSTKLHHGHADEPMDIAGPGEPEARLVGTSTMGRSYKGPSTLSALQFMQDYRAALTKAGWTIVFPAKPADDSTNARLIAHYAKDGRELWASLFYEYGATLSFNAVDVGADDFSRALTKDCHVRLYGVTFDFDKATLKPESKPALEKAAAAIKAVTGAIEVQGHTDDKGAADYNVTLSTQRALAVKEWLQKAGVPAARLTSKGYGKQLPVADNATELGRAKNRRVELVRAGCH